MYSVDKNNNIILTRGDSFYADVTINKDDGTIYTPENGDTVRFAVKHNKFNPLKTEYTDPSPLIFKTIPIDTMQLSLEPSDTKAYGFGEYAYDIEITFADGDVDTFIRGTFTLTPEVD